MRHPVLVALYLVVMVAVIVGIDIAFLRDHFWARLAVNIGIVAVFLVGYAVFFRRPLR